MPRFNNRGFGGQPTRPFSDFLLNANSDCWLELTFVDRNGAAETPTGLTYRIDNLTDSLVIQNTTSIGPPAGNTFELNIPASLNQMSYNWRGSQVMQVLVTSTYADGSTDAEVFVYTLCATPTVGAGA